MKIAKLLVCSVLVVMFLSFQVQDVKAYSYDYNIGDGVTDTFDPIDLDDFLDDNNADFTAYTSTSTLSGTYWATFIGYRATHVNEFLASDETGANFFITDRNVATGAHSVAGDFFKIDADTAYFDDTTNGPHDQLLKSSTFLSYYKLDENWSYTGNSGIKLDFFKGDIIVGFGDDSGDLDGLDLVIAISDVNREVPIPGAIWLLGSGLLGLVGIRRRKNN